MAAISRWLRKASPRELVRSLRNASLDLRFGGLCGGYEANPTPGAHATGATDYAIMEQIFAGRICAEDVLVDVGCGNGRVINWWLSRGLTNPIYGIELLDKVAERTSRRLSRYKNVHILSGDATTHLPAHGTLFYLFNPFDNRFMQPIAIRLAGLARQHPLTVLYYAPTFIEAFDPEVWEISIQDIRLPSAGIFEERHRQLAVISPRRA